MNQFLTIFQIVISILLIGAILIQQRGEGLGSAFGGGGGNAYSSRRGFEKLLLTSTIVLAILFVGSAFVSLLI